MPDGRPNILVIWGDDIGISNLSCYSRGMMGYFTPNIDRIATEGMLFTDSYGEQSCTAGRSSFITGQSVYRTGMSKVGMPGVDIGLQKEDPTIAELLKPLGYATGQFGKNHLGDLNKYLPTAHGFDEFFGNLYHLNAEEEPEHEDYPTPEEAPLLRKALLPRGVIHSWATEEDSGEVDDRYGPVGRQRIEDTGPLTKKRMETIDDETTAACAGRNVVGESVVLQVAQQFHHRRVAARGVRAAECGVDRVVEEGRDPVGMLLDGEPGVRREDSSRKSFHRGVVTVVVTGDGVAEPGQVAGRSRPIRRIVCQRRVCRGLLGQPADQEVELDVGRLLTPQRAVVVEHRDPLLGGDVAHRAIDELDDRGLRGAVAPGVQNRQVTRRRSRGTSRAPPLRCRS